MTQRNFDEYAGHLPVDLLAAAVENWRGDYDKLRIETARGDINCRLYDADNAQAAVIMVGGVGEAFDSPAQSLYPRLAVALRDASISALRLEFRQARDFEEAVHDVRAAVRFLHADEAINKVGLIGHSLGGAVVMAAACLEPDVEAVVALAGQGTKTDIAASLNKPLLVIHGKNDRLLPPLCSSSIYERAALPKELLLVEADDDLNDAEQEVFDRSFDWMLSWLKRPLTS